MKLIDLIIDLVFDRTNLDLALAETRAEANAAAHTEGGPIMQSVGMTVATSTANVLSSFASNASFAFSQWMNNTFGNSSMPVNIIANPGGFFDGWIDQIKQSMEFEKSIGGEAQSPFMASRMLLGQLPTDIRDLGQSLLQGILGMVLPGFMAGPLADIIGTATGLRAIISPQAALASGISADSGGFADYPWKGGTHVFDKNFQSAGNLTDTERAVRDNLLMSMRRLGIS